MDWCLYGDDKRKEMDRDLNRNIFWMTYGDIRMYLVKNLV